MMRLPGKGGEVMVTMKEVLSQFKRLGIRPSFLAKNEVKELPRILLPGEALSHVVMGWYNGGLALLCSTNYRVLLIDKKPFFLTVEDLRYNMIAEVKYQYRLLDANVCLNYMDKSLDFKSWNQGKLRALVSHVQEAIMENKRVGDQDTRPQTPSYTPEPQPNMDWQPKPVASPAQYYQPLQPANWPKNPYKTRGKLIHGDRASRFVAQNQTNQ